MNDKSQLRANAFFSMTPICIAAAVLGTSLVGVAVNAGPALSQSSASSAACGKLANWSLPDAKITTAEIVSESFSPPTPVGSRPRAPLHGLPEFCRVAATLTPTADSDIKIEVWMPTAGWNHKFMGIGNGVWLGSISYDAMAPVLARGYAVASTDTGHQGGFSDATFAVGHPEKLNDFGYRAVHELTVKAKRIVAAFYKENAHLSYWKGCSSGGRQGLKEAQEYPEDYNGIIAGAPAHDWVNLLSWEVSIAQAVHKDPESAIPPDKLKLLHDAVLNQCDAIDGAKDGLLEDPRHCKFDPSVLQCSSGDAPTCLTVKQVESVKKIYAPLKSPKSGEILFPGLEPGSELRWDQLAGSRPFEGAVNLYRSVVYADPAWDFLTLDIDRDLAQAKAANDKAGHIVAMNTDLSAFKKQGGKLLQYAGWSDQLIPPESGVSYYEKVVDRFGTKKAEDFYRMFMVPGMAHCAGGDGGVTDDFDSVTVLEEWVEKHSAPSIIIASHIERSSDNPPGSSRTTRTRPLCAYPKIARWKETGSIDEAQNFECVAPAKVR